MRGLLLGGGHLPRGQRGSVNRVNAFSGSCKERSLVARCLYVFLTGPMLTYAIVVVALVSLVIWLVVSFADVFMECSDELSHLH